MGKRKHKKSYHVNHNPNPNPVTPNVSPLPKQETMSNTKKLKQVKEFNGLLSCILTHDIEKTTAQYEWTGPKIDLEEWQKMLAFFRWTNGETHSESQVRMFVNHRTRAWKIWAFPQKRGTGMTAQEIDNADARTQRAQFSDADGWLYYGTVHHHCTSSAFQSGTDQSNEHNQDGLHITIGHLDKPQYDIDCRLYQSGYKLVDFDINQFWDVGNPLEGVSPLVVSMLPPDYKKRFVKLQMGTPPPEDQEFPEIWRTNLIREPAPMVHTHIHNGMITSGGHGAYYNYTNRPFITRAALNLEWDGKRAIKAIGEWINAPAQLDIVDLSLVMQAVTDLDELTEVHMDIFDILCKNDVTPSFFLTLVDDLKKKMKEDEDEEKMRRKRIKQLPHVPEETMDYEGGSQIPGYGMGFGLGG